MRRSVGWPDSTMGGEAAMAGADLEETIHHEAAHAVAGMALGIPILYATVRPIGRKGGAVSVRGHVQPHAAYRHRLETDLVFFLAGPVAGALHTRTRFRCSAANRRKWSAQIPSGPAAELLRTAFFSIMGQTDEFQAEELARRIVRRGRAQSVRRCLDAATARAEDILRRNQPAVERVAAALRRHGTVREAHLLRLGQREVGH